MITYNKLVRDRIPDIIKQNGEQCVVRVLDDDEYLAMLNVKLGEELKEYLESGDVEELADLAEVMWAVVEAQGLSKEQFDEIRLTKREKRGGFKDRLLLVQIGE
ncbi:nucleoside triphosphate pyrophosphohydrolase [Alicyclobacillus curvatus]|nr:nucleoside triphosphate pyrophosphohydrolase [Alicyclobacillus curvatus]